MPTYVSEAIPLCPALGVELVLIVVRNILEQRLNGMDKLLAPKPWLFRYVKRQTTRNVSSRLRDARWVGNLLQRNNSSGLDLSGRNLHTLRCQEIQPSNLYIIRLSAPAKKKETDLNNTLQAIAGKLT